MSNPEREAVELTYPLRTAARLTGLSPELLRAWEKRHAVVVPQRTAGGTRRYTATELERLRLVKAAVDAGHRIGEVAALDDAALRARAEAGETVPSARRFEEIFAALERLDPAESQRLLSLQLSALGPVRFARDFAVPLMQEIGARWAEGRIGIASEHLATAVIRSMLGSALQPTAISQLGPVIVFATPSGERHELGLQMAALTALGAGANPVYLGAELPIEDLLGAAQASGCAALVLGLVTVSAAQTERTLGALRGGLPPEIHLWIGGHAANDVESIEGVEQIDTLEELEQRVTLLGLERR